MNSPNKTFFPQARVLSSQATVVEGMIEQLWVIENCGICAWPINVHIKSEDGKTVPIPSAQPNSVIELKILFEAPREHGRYHYKWRLQTPQNIAFGEKLYSLFII